MALVGPRCGGGVEKPTGVVSGESLSLWPPAAVPLGALRTK